MAKTVLIAACLVLVLPALFWVCAWIGGGLDAVDTTRVRAYNQLPDDRRWFFESPAFYGTFLIALAFVSLGVAESRRRGWDD